VRGKTRREMVKKVQVLERFREEKGAFQRAGQRSVSGLTVRRAMPSEQTTEDAAFDTANA
jgi:hypothetical protein